MSVPNVPSSTLSEIAAALARAEALDAPLSGRLASFADDLRIINRPFAEAVDRLVHRLAASGAGAGAPAIGDRFPDFVLPNDAGHLVSLSDIIADGPAAVIFHRGHWCPYCHLTHRALAAMSAEAEQLGARLVSITPEGGRYARRLNASSGARLPLLIDVDNGYALSLGLAIWVGEEMRAHMTSIGRDLNAYHGNDSWFLPIPAAFVVDQNGIVRARNVDPDYRRRMEVSELLAGLAAARRP